MKIDSTYKLEIFESIATLNKAAAEYIITIANQSITARGRFTIVLSGGKTPQKLFSLLAESPFRDRIQWGKTFVFWGDERCVPLEDVRNNAQQARSMLLDKIDIPSENIYPIPVNLSPIEAAGVYENELKHFFGKDAYQFDLILLGLGENGHAASLFPGTNVIDEQATGVRAVYLATEDSFRITMTANLINQAGTILFLVSGKEKAAILKKTLSTFRQPQKIPAQLIKPVHGELRWFADVGAASLISVGK